MYGNQLLEEHVLFFVASDQQGHQQFHVFILIETTHLALSFSQKSSSLFIPPPLFFS